jgi:tRNA(Ile)-lysidine synthase
VVEQGTHKPLVGGSNPPSATTPLEELASAVARGTDALDLPNDAELWLAVSGGGDSMALLHGADRLVRTGARRWRVTVAHVDHGLRAGSGVDADAVRAAAESMGLPVVVHRADVASLAAAEGRSIEDAGREARYRFFEMAAPAGAYVATAHTRDDLVETVLINLLRGTGLAGVAGMPARRGRVIRPLLEASGATLRGLLTAAGVAWRDDPSNDDPSFLRNGVRAELLPLLEQLRPGAADRIGQYASLARDDDALLDDLAAVELTARRGPDGSIDWRAPPPRALARRVLRLAIGAPAPNAERVEALLEAADGPRGGLRIELGAGRVASVRGRRIRIGA